MKAVFVALALLASVAFAYNATNGNIWTQNGIHTDKGPGYLGQINGHNCGPHALMQCIYKITGVDMKEATLAQWAGTTQSGTDHEGIERALSKFNSLKGYNLKIEWYYSSDVSVSKIGEWMASSKECIFYHLLYRNTWGHYELPYNITEGSDYLDIANSLGDRCGEGYYGYIEPRSWSDQKSYIRGISQKSVCHVYNPN